MTTPFAEVIGDPIAQSLSPLIHRHWLAALGLRGDYDATRITPEGLGAHIARRRAEAGWRGCNVTIPHKQRIVPLLDAVDPAAAAIGAVNCVVPGAAGLTGYNTDIDGIAAALDATALEDRSVVLIGAGGAARAAVAYLAGRRIAQLIMIVRDPAKAESLRGLIGTSRFRAVSFEGAADVLEGAAAIVNASPLGMTGAPAMPGHLLDAIAGRTSGATQFDMVYKPLETPFLAAAGASGARTVDGLTMLIGQARRAFALLFGAAAPDGDGALRGLLVTASGHSSGRGHGEPLNG